MGFEEGVDRPSNVDLDRFLNVSVAGVVFVFAGAWIYGVQNRRFDYDELEHTHVIWLLSIGLLPFTDFFECHPPFLWYPFAGVLRLLGNTYELLFVFRGLSALGHLLFFAACAMNVAASLQRLGRPLPRFARDFTLAVVLLASHPEIFVYLVEFRLDPWPNALLLLSIAYDRRPRSKIFLPSAFFGFFSTIAVLCSPKLLAFQAIFFALRILSAHERGRRAAGAAVGATAAVGLSVFALLALGFAPFEVLRLSLGYHRLLNAHGGFGFGLATRVFEQPALVGIVILGIAGWMTTARSKIARFPFELALCVFLPLQLLLVAFPLKQYVAPWFLLGACFLPYVAPAFGRSPHLRIALVAAVLLSIGIHLGDSARLFARGAGDATGAIAVHRQLEALVPEDQRVVAPMELRPLFRRDVFYHIATSFAPSGYDTERIMEALDMKPMSARFTREAYAEELEATPPALIVDVDWYTTRQRAAVDAYLARHGEDYLRLDDPSAYVRRSSSDGGASGDRIRR